MKSPYILNKYTENNEIVTEYTIDGETISHIVRVPIPQEIEPIEPVPTIEEQILFETQYQTAVLEILTLGGM